MRLLATIVATTTLLACNVADLDPAPDAGSVADTGGALACDPADCDDGDPCTADSCVDGACVHGPDEGARCDDGDACTTEDRCDAEGACAGTPREVPDLVCVDCACDPIEGMRCVRRIAGSACDDGDCCTDNDRCQLCDPDVDPGCGAYAIGCYGDAVSCDDDNACTEERCACSAGQAECLLRDLDDGAPCVAVHDGCTEDDRCVAGACEPGTPLRLDDDDACTLDVCKAGVVAHSPVTCEVPTCGVAAACDPKEGCVAEWAPPGATESLALPAPGEAARDKSIGTGPPEDPDGTSAVLLCGGSEAADVEHRALLAFDLGGPAASVVTASLTLWVDALDAPPALALDRVVGPWTATSAWEDAPAAVEVTLLAPPTEPGPWAVELTDLAAAWAASSDAPLSLQLRSAASADDASAGWVSFASAEDDNATRRPRLDVEVGCDAWRQ